MKVLIFSLLLPILILSFFGCTKKNKSPLIEELRGEAALAMQESETCDAFTKSRLEGDGADMDKKFHLSRSEAIAALEFLEKRPLSHPHGDKVRQIFLDRLSELSREPDQNEVVAQMRYIVGNCGLFHTFHLPQLIGDKEKYNFSAADRARVDKLARQILQENLEVPGGIIFRAVQIHLLKKYVMAEYRGRDKEQIVENLQMLLDRFEIERKVIPARSRDAKLLHGEDTVLFLEYEQEVSRIMAMDYALQARKVFPELAKQ